MKGKRARATYLEALGAVVLGAGAAEESAILHQHRLGQRRDPGHPLQHGEEVVGLAEYRVGCGLRVHWLILLCSGDIRHSVKL